jgi:uncharacterized protein YndB with AHSA1/START domain
MNNYSATATITINVPAAKVWDALTNPEMVKQYLFGTSVASDWQKGSPITYTGEWQGKAYEDKGEILEVEPGKLLKTTYFSSMSGQEDVPENYSVVTYALTEENETTTLSITQENTKDQASADQSKQNWDGVLSSLKALLEK